MSNFELGTKRMKCVPGEFRSAEENGKRYIEGLFAVFNSDYNIGPDMSESVDPHAFDETINDDIRCLADHDTRIVLGRTSANTFEVSITSRGLWGRVLVNPNDQEAMNVLARVDRGDINQASFGFDILDEETEFRADGSVHWTIKKVKLYECSIVAFPAYEDTELDARTKEKETLMKREFEKWKAEMREKLKGVK